MKKVLITGAHSYVGEHVKQWLLKTPDFFSVEVLDMQSESWKEADFSRYDSVFHVAGIAHVSKDKKIKDLYYAVNRDLAIATAQKAKESGVKQFVFMSSMIVYNGLSGKERKKGITDKTQVKTCDYYGDSKAQADLAIQKMQSEQFNVVIVRPPMIFGKDSKGNFPRLIKLATKVPFFPKVKNKRSMLYIENLCEFIKLAIESNAGGVFFPQNQHSFSTTDIVRQIAKSKGKRVWISVLFNIPMYLLYPFVGSLKKLFGNLYYTTDTSLHFEGNYQIVDNNNSIDRSIT